MSRACPQHQQGALSQQQPAFNLLWLSSHQSKSLAPRLQGGLFYAWLHLIPSCVLTTVNTLTYSPTSALPFAPLVQVLLPPTGLWKWLFDLSSFQFNLVRWASEYWVGPELWGLSSLSPTTSGTLSKLSYCAHSLHCLGPAYAQTLPTHYFIQSKAPWSNPTSPPTHSSLFS